MEEFLNKFLFYLTSHANFSKHTIKAYRYDLEEFKKFIEGKSIKKINEIDRFSIRAYIVFLSEKKLKKNTLIRKISAVRSFFKFLISKNIIEDNPFALINMPKKEKNLPRFLTEEEMFKLLDLNVPIEVLSKNLNYKFAFRDYAIVMLIYSSGLRRSEVSNLNIGDIDIYSGFVRVVGKGMKERTVPVGDNAMEAIKKYLETRKDRQAYDPLFLDNKHKRLTDAGIAYVLKKMAKRARFAREINPHAIRHSFATHMLNNGCDIRAIQEMLGHKNLATTQIYTHLSIEHLKEIYDKFHPRSKK